MGYRGDEGHRQTSRCVSVSQPRRRYEWSSAWRMRCACCPRGYVWVIRDQIILAIVSWLPELFSRGRGDASGR